jgi:hypothetical protein
MTMDRVTVELCRSNSVGSRYSDPQVIEYRTVDRAEAARLLAIRATDGTFWREQRDRTGAVASE